MSELIEHNQAMIINRVELDVEIATAKAYPRDMAACIGEALSIIKSDKETAESCFYCLPARKNKDGSKSEPIKGPSVRLGEVIAYCWGNLRIATRETGNDGKFITVEGVCWDLQKNIKIVTEVKRSIKTKDGRTYGADMQVVTSNAAQSIALRNSIFRVIPKHIINNLYGEAMKTAVGDMKSLNEVRAKAIANFAKAGIEKDRILAYFGVETVDEITSEHLTILLGIKQSLVERRLTKENCFDANPETGEVSSPHIDDLKDLVDGA
jgi:hypothetical protein